MRFKSLVSPLALTFALGLGGAAVAQDAMEMTIQDGTMMINGAELNAEQTEGVQSYCNALEDEFENDTAGGVAEDPVAQDDDEDDSDADEGTESRLGGGDDTDGVGDDETSSPLEDQPVTFDNFDYSQVSRDDCIEAGFIEG